MGCPVSVFATAASVDWSGGLQWSGGLLCKKGAQPRSNDAVERASPRAQKLPAGRASFEMVRGHDAKRTRGRVTRGRETPGRRPRIRGDPLRITKQTPAARRRETPHKDTNNTLKSRAGSRPRSPLSPALPHHPIPQKQKRSRRRSLSTFPRALDHSRSTRAPSDQP